MRSRGDGAFSAGAARGARANGAGRSGGGRWGRCGRRRGAWATRHRRRCDRAAAATPTGARRVEAGEFGYRLQIDQDRAGARGDLAQPGVVGREAAREHARCGPSRQEDGREQHVGAGFAQSADRDLDLIGDARDVDARLYEVVGSDEHRHQVGSERQARGHLLVDEVTHAPTADGEVRILEGSRSAAAPRRGGGEELGETIRPPPVHPRRHARRVAEPLRDRVAQRDVAPPERRPLARGGQLGTRPHPGPPDAVDRVQLRRALIVADQGIAEALPGPPGDGVSGRSTEGSPLRRIPRKVSDPTAEVVRVSGPVQPPVDAAADEVEGSAAPGRDDRHPARLRLLDGLTERLALTGMHEHVEARHRRRERVALQVTEEDGIRQEVLQTRPRGPVAHDDQSNAGQRAERRQIFDLFLGGEPPDISDDDVAVSRFRNDTPTPGLVAAVGREADAVDPAAPDRDAIDTEVLQLPPCRVGGSERQRRATMQPPHVRRRERRGVGNAVPLGVRDDVGLVDGDARQTEPLGREQPLPPEEERRSEMHDIGPERSQRPCDRGHGRRRHPHRGVPGHRNRTHRPPRHGERMPPPRTRRDDEGLVPAVLEVLEHPQHGTGDPVHVGQERLGDHRDSHETRVAPVAHPRAAKQPVSPTVHAILGGRSPRGRLSVAVPAPFIPG
ncbi:MAG: hypothetical protein K0S49_448 [Microbacterium sp.]|nr:hypothetical protein [Microbacterium sp.]